MIKADMIFINGKNFYNQVNSDNEKVTGYELFFQVILEFKIKFNYSIHSFNESEKLIQFNFKSDYAINLKENSNISNTRYIELCSSNDSIENFVERFNYLKEIINKMNVR